ncbi:MAG: DUF4398 domain-containing protein [Treponema sp.]|nr:DUF4398 domain-containing protein [Treponema sp.]
MKKHIAALSTILVLGLVLAACATPPTEEMNRAHDAVIRAENDPNAVAYAGNLLVRARDALTRMQSEADARRFDAARNFANEAISAAERAITDGMSGAARARDEAANLVGSLSAPLADTSAAVGAAQQAGNLALDFDTLGWDLDSAHQTYGNARQNLEAHNYADAIAQGQNVRVLLSDINSRLNEAVQIAAVRK